MTNYPAAGKTPRRPLLWIGISCFVVAFAVSGVFLVKLLGVMPASPQRVGEGPVQLDGEGLTVFASQRGADADCRATDATGGDIPLQRPSRSEQWDDGGQTYYVVAHSVNKVPAQAVAVDCEGAAEVTYFVGRRHTLGTFLPLALAALGSFSVFAAAGLILIIVDSVRRRRAGVHPR
jgi:hypothetical protein